VQHEDMRDWLEQVDALGELRVDRLVCRRYALNK